MSDVSLLYATAPDAETARRIARTLVEEGLAACVNILGPIQSVYRWNGAVETAAEIAILVKTASAPAARDAIVKMHPYETPAIVALRVDRPGSSGAFLDWVEKNSTT